jgi:hypothetical protein
VLSLFHDGVVVNDSTSDLRYNASNKAGSYRVEVQLAHAPGDPPIPWLVSNPIFVPTEPGTAGTSSAGTPAPSGRPAPPARAAIAPFPWRIEKDPASSAILRTTDRAAEIEYRLAPGERNSQFVAVATDVHDAVFTALRFALQSDRPSRVWVQVRTADGHRWGRSYYVDPAGSEIMARLEDLRPMAGERGKPYPATLTSILLVIDLTNASPGHGGRLTVLHSDLVK